MQGRLMTYLKSYSKRLVASLPDPLNLIPYVCLDFKAAHGYYPNIFFPTTFNEKIQRRKLFDRRPILKLLADKHAVRGYVTQKISQDILPKLYCVTDDPSKIDLESLPGSFVVKPTHGSGWVRVVRDKASVTKDELVQLCSCWLSCNYYDQLKEWAYKDIRPQIVIEEFLDDGTGKAPMDYKCFVFGGKVALIQVDIDRFSRHTRNLYDVNWDRVNVKKTIDSYEGDVARPDTLNNIIRYAEILGSDLDFIRADFYSIGNRVVFGELTATPGSGLGKFDPASFDRRLGKLWKMQL